VTKDRTADGHALTEARKQLKEETQLRLDVEKELEAQIGMRQEMELAMKMLEKDVCEKQDALVALRQQLDDLRALKHELSFKLQSSDMGVKQKSELNSRLEEKTNQMAATIKQLEQRLRQAEKDRQLAQQDNRLFKQEFGDKINSLQLEVEELSRQRPAADVEARSFLVAQGDGKLKIQEENAKLKQPLREENSVLPDKSPSGTQEEQEQLLEPGNAEICQLCQEESSRSKKKNICKNCGGIFCEACSANELPLPSSIDPQRVCNPCHKQLIQQYSNSPLLQPLPATTGRYAAATGRYAGDGASAREQNRSVLRRLPFLQNGRFRLCDRESFHRRKEEEKGESLLRCSLLPSRSQTRRCVSFGITVSGTGTADLRNAKDLAGKGIIQRHWTLGNNGERQPVLSDSDALRSPLAARPTSRYRAIWKPARRGILLRRA
ncbi:PREDICTED: protein RUFY3, partial [Eurypyga helias]|uniref:protein RUFY3 n=1 Tax=Eurypyga helias TaxID=54383 RepID=UPI000528E215